MSIPIFALKSRFKTVLKTLPLLVVFAALQSARGETLSGPVGLQLESVSGALKQNMSATLGRVHNFGFKYVELVGDYNLSPGALTAELRAHDLVAVSAHFPYARFRDDPEGVAREGAALGLKYAGCPSLPQHEALDENGCRDAIAVFNRAGEALAKQGITFFYHPHGYEFKPHGDGTFFDQLMAETKPEFVHFQMDIFWIVHAGQDPVKLLQKYGNRWVSMHLKDMKKGTPTGRFNGHADKAAFVPLGRGQIDLPAAFHEANKIGIQWYFIEDESAHPEAQIPLSLNYLRVVKW
ncbi:MAG TPA: TIM barrel protein [Verrucomicrobiae bacterium]|nr:TIM barrel protein [Verrucomicrobiae bacterium]